MKKRDEEEYVGGRNRHRIKEKKKRKTRVEMIELCKRENYQEII